MAYAPLLRAVALFCAWAVTQNIHAAVATEKRIECPSEIAQDSIPAVRAPNGWTSSTRSGLRLHAVDLSYGPPSQMTFLKPEEASRGGKGMDKWSDLHLRPPGDGGIWIGCNYGNSDNVVLGKRLDDTVSECTATYTRDKQGAYLVNIGCKFSR
jgi:hypothetical protein